MYDEVDDQSTVDDATPPEESGNKTFVIAAGILGVMVLLTCIGVAVYGFYFLPKQTAARNASQATQVAQEQQVSQGLTEQALSVMLSQVPEASPTVLPTETPVFQQATSTVVLIDPQTATVAAALTQAAQAQLTVTGMPTSTLLPNNMPNTGFIDDVGGPGLVVMSIALVIVILLARRLRNSPVK
jgi:hypothetical protein